MDEQATIASLFAARVKQPADVPSLLIWRGDQLTPITLETLVGDVAACGMALEKLGIGAGDRVAQVSENRYEWVVLDLALLVMGAVHVPVHATMTGAQVKFQIANSEAKIVLLSGPHQAAKLAAHRPLTAEVYSYDPCEVADSGVPIRTWEEVLPPVRENAHDWVMAHAESRRPDNLATILHTSGTTGDPKGVVLSHGNLASNAVGTLSAFPQRSEDIRLGWLPLSHIFARTCDLYTWLATPGMTLAVGRGRDTVVQDCQTVQPSLLNGVPYFFEKVARFLGSQDPPGRAQDLLGGKLRMCNSGGAALPDAVARFFNDQGILLVQGYGLTETSPVITVDTEYRTGSVGRPIPGVEVKIADDGEILTRGPHVMLGYWNLPEATADVLRDGWFYTGDLGRQDEDGFVYITGRKKEIIVTSGGKNVAPQMLEGLLTQHPLIEQAVVFGDDRPFLTALVVPNFDALAAAVAESGGGSLEKSQLLENAQARELLRQAIDQRLVDVSQHEQVGRFAILADPFSIEAGELTPTLKLRRGVIAEKFAQRIGELYESRDESSDLESSDDAAC